MEDLLALCKRPLPEEELLVCFDEKPLALHTKAHSPSSPRIRDGSCGSENTREKAPPIPSARVEAKADDTSPEYSEPLLAQCKELTNSFGEQASGWGFGADSFRIYTPKRGDWLNQAEIEVSLFSRHCQRHAGSPICITCGTKPPLRTNG